jgi:hypothetical protein
MEEEDHDRLADLLHTMPSENLRSLALQSEAVVWNERRTSLQILGCDDEVFLSIDLRRIQRAAAAGA